VAIVRAPRNVTSGSLGDGVPVTLPASQPSEASPIVPSSGNARVTGRLPVPSAFTVQSWT
jgi:hypothetical protein